MHVALEATTIPVDEEACEFVLYRCRDSVRAHGFVGDQWITVDCSAATLPRLRLETLGARQFATHVTPALARSRSHNRQIARRRSRPEASTGRVPPGAQRPGPVFNAKGPGLVVDHRHRHPVVLCPPGDEDQTWRETVEITTQRNPTGRQAFSQVHSLAHKAFVHQDHITMPFSLRIERTTVTIPVDGRPRVFAGLAAGPRAIVHATIGDQQIEIHGPLRHLRRLRVESNDKT